MSHLQKLMEKMLQLEDSFDFTMVAAQDGERLGAHRNVIEASCSKVEVISWLQRELIVPGASGDRLRATIAFIYTGHIDLTFDNVYDISSIANSLGIAMLEHQCADFMAANLTLKSCVRTLSIAVECEYFELFQKSWKFICEVFAATYRDDDDSIFTHILNCFNQMEFLHTEVIPDALRTIRLKHVPFKFLSDVLAPMFAKHGLTTMLLKEFSRRPCSLSPVRSNTSGESVYCVHYSSALKHVIVHKYSPCSNSWTEVTSISCVSECVRFVYSKGKLITIADQGHIRVVESYDLSDSFARTVHTQTMPWRAGFRPIAVGDYVYMLAGIGWHSDPTEHLSNGSFLRLCTEYGRKIECSWQMCQSLSARQFRFSMASLNERIYVAGGDDGHTYSGQFHCYDTRRDEWTEKASVRLQSTNAVLFASRKCLYAVGNNFILHKYDPDEDDWTENGHFRKGGSVINTVALHDEIYAICRGGRFGIIEINERGADLDPLNPLPVDIDPFHQALLFVH